MEYDHDHHHSPSFRDMIKLSMCCFTYNNDELPPSDHSSSSGSDDEGLHRRRLVSKSWMRSRAHDLPEEIKDKCASFFSKIGSRGSRRTANTFEFRYDPMSYALNFDDESARVDEFPFRNFSSRLPLSPLPENRSPASVY